MTTTQKPSKALNIFLWIAQSLLAATFLWAAFMKLFQSPEQLAAMWPWTAEHPALVKITGVVDLLAGLGLLVPSLVNKHSPLTVYAAWGTILLMLAAGVFHISRGEASQIGFNVFCAVLAGFIAWGRRRPMSSR
jgi:uncharacterized membrane protein